MKIYSVGSTNYQNYQKRNYTKIQLREQGGLQKQHKAQNQIAFQGTKGGLLGILGGATIGLVAAAAIVATGGAAAAIAAVGLPGVLAGGAAAGTHVGGIAGSIIEEKLSEDDDKKNRENK